MSGNTIKPHILQHLYAMTKLVQAERKVFKRMFGVLFVDAGYYGYFCTSIKRNDYGKKYR